MRGISAYNAPERPGSKFAAFSIRAGGPIPTGLIVRAETDPWVSKRRGIAVLILIYGPAKQRMFEDERNQFPVPIETQFP